MAQIILIISDDKIAEFKTGFLKLNPKPEGMTDMQWIKTFLINTLRSEYMKGKERINQENQSIEGVEIT